MVDQTPVIESVAAPDEQHVAALAGLIPQLSSAPPPDLATLEEIVRQSGTTLLIARVADEIIGSLLLQTFRTPTGIRAWIEDVVVDEAARGQGAGSALVRRALEVAEQQGARTVDLTSRPSREDANALYRRLGFVQRETNVYRVTLENSPSAGSTGRAP